MHARMGELPDTYAEGADGPAAETQTVSVRSTAELAKHLGLHRTTVSRAINAHGNISPKTRERVIRAAKRLGFYPLLAGRRLAAQRNFTIGVMFPGMASKHHREMFDGIQEVVREKGDYLCVPQLTHVEPEMIDRIASEFLRLGIDGMIVEWNPHFAERWLPVLRQRGIACVVTNCGDIRKVHTSCVAEESSHGGYDLFVRTCPPDTSQVHALVVLQEDFEDYRRRLNGVLEAARERGADVIQHDMTGMALGPVRTLCAELAADPDCRAILSTVTPYVLPMYVGVALDARRRIGRDIVLGSWADVRHPLVEGSGIYLAMHPSREWGRVAGRMLFEHIADPGMPARCVTLPIEIVRLGT